jgi:hypothetical protein
VHGPQSEGISQQTLGKILNPQPVNLFFENLLDTSDGNDIIKESWRYCFYRPSEEEKGFSAPLFGGVGLI